MKKTKLFILVMICISLIGCGSKGRPDDLSDEHYEAAKDIIVVIDNYIDKRITIDQASNKAWSIADSFSISAESDSTEAKLYHVAFMVKYAFFNEKNDGIVDIDELEDYKEEILDYIGE